MALDLHLRKGALKQSMGIPMDQKIPSGKLEAAANSPNKLKARRARLAITMMSWHHK